MYSGFSDMSGDGGGSGMEQLRIAFYSHDAMGIGHMRRNLLLAQTLVGLPSSPAVLLVGGARQLNALALPDGVDCLTLPALRKRPNGTYRPRSLRLRLSRLVGLRARTIRAAVAAFRPHLFVVDKLPRGLLGELDPTIRHLRENGRTRLVLGVRDILDEPAAARRDLLRWGSEEVIRTCYDAVWVYGDPAVYDPAVEYGLSPGVVEKIRYAGYLDPRARAGGRPEGTPWPAGDLPPARLIVCEVGGGQDGGRLTEIFARAPLPPDATGLILPGPFMPEPTRRRLEAIAARRTRLRLLPFIPEPMGLLGRADRIVAMGGYNTVCEVLALEKAALVVPRVRPRQEQLIRARRFAELGFLDVLHPDRASPAAVADWLFRDREPPRGVRERVDFAGLDRLPYLVEDVLRGGAGTRDLVPGVRRLVPSRADGGPGEAAATRVAVKTSPAPGKALRVG